MDLHACGIICEYDPFHKGHAFHIKRAREETGCTHVIGVMSASFVQRGTPALTDKWTRARMALAGGCDLVLELPTLFSMRDAAGFAAGGISLLAATGLTSSVSFGCEREAIPYLLPAADLLETESDAFAQEIRKSLALGMSYPRARGHALAQALGTDENVIALPNFMLGIEYTLAARRLFPQARLVPVPRDTRHDDPTPGASASAIRTLLLAGKREAAAACVPCPELLPQSTDALARPDALDDALLLRLREMTPDAIACYPGANEGLENRIAKKSGECASIEELLTAVKSRRYTMARLRRILCGILLASDRALQARAPLPTYLRVLGVKRSAIPLLRELTRRATLPVVTDASSFPKDDPVFRLETRATDLRGLCTKDREQRLAGRDYTQKFLVVDG